MRLNLRLALVLLVGLVAVGSIWSGVQSTSPAKDGTSSLPATKSASLVIDFGADSGLETKVIKVSDLSSDATGWQLIVESGTVVKGTDQYPTGFVCRLDGWPTEDAETCDETPTYADGHWAYFVASKKLGGNWMLSGQGAAARIVECGSYEGWKWVGPKEESTPPSVLPDVIDCRP